MKETEELLDIVDDNDNIIGQMVRKEVHDKHLRNYRSINVFLVNSEGKIWVPRRTKKKRIAPGGLDFSTGGHVESGETYEEALLKEVSEELNIDLKPQDFDEVAYLTPADGVHSFQRVYLVKTNNVPKYNPDDFTDYYWLTPRELVAKIEDGEKAKEDIVPVVNKVFMES